MVARRRACSAFSSSTKGTSVASRPVTRLLKPFGIGNLGQNLGFQVTPVTAQSAERVALSGLRPPAYGFGIDPERCCDLRRGQHGASPACCLASCHSFSSHVYMPVCLTAPIC